MTNQLQNMIDAAQQLPPDDQLKLIEALSRSLRNRYQPTRIDGRLTEFVPTRTIPAQVRRTAPVKDLSCLKADFWPEDESADDINAFIAEQRCEDLLSE